MRVRREDGQARDELMIGQRNNIGRKDNIQRKQEKKQKRARKQGKRGQRMFKVERYALESKANVFFWWVSSTIHIKLLPLVH